jgi:UDP-N-acetyl-alpha-D-muramoyl-L-alanyl-L-glutamate epimerase
VPGVRDVTTTGASRGTQLRRLREAYPVFRISGVRATRGQSGVRLEFAFAAGPLEFRPAVELTGLSREESALVTAPTARRMVRALAIIEAFSYWKALCSPVIEVAIPPPDDAELDWWQAFWPGAMGEFFYRNGIDYAEPGFLVVKAAADPEPAGLTGGGPGERTPGPPLVMFSGGKDSLALARVVRSGGAPADFFLYNAASRQRALAESLAGGGRFVEVRREILPGLLRLNAAGHPNGHTPFSAYLAVAAMLAGYLRGSEFALAGNSRSDDEPNVESYLGRPVNHQWTKSYEFEAALSSYRDRWLPGAPAYCSPLRPLYELQIIASLSDDIDGYLRTASCNRVRGDGWCRSCAKCAWVFLATAALFGHDLAVAKTGGDMFADPGLAPLYAEMAGLTGPKPFECTGSEDEVRTAIRAVTRGHAPGDFPALAACLADPATAAARPLSALLADWGRDDLVPAAILRQVRAAVGAAGQA